MGYYLVATSALLPFSYVGLLHLADKGGTDRNHTSSIKKRCTGAIVCTILSTSLTYGILKYMNVDSPLNVMGFRYPSLLKAILLPAALINILYLGQWVMLYFDGQLGYIFGYQQLKNYGFDACWLRDSILAPITEEITFRACSATLLAQYFSPSVSTLIAPLFFSLSHLHHIGDDRRRGLSLKQAILQRTFQCLYTYLFGLYATDLFFSTRHVIAPIITHSICNCMGLPSFSEIETFPKKSDRVILWTSYIAGLVGFIALSKRFISSEFFY